MAYKFRSVKITHDILHRIDFSYIAEFFRFMGILVCEDILIEYGKNKTPEEKEAEKNTVYSAEIYIGKREINCNEAIELGSTEMEYQNKLKGLSGKTIFLYDDPQIESRIKERCPEEVLPSFSISCEENGVQKQILARLLNNILDVIYDKQDENAVSVSELNDLINIYVDRKLWLHSMNMQYYAGRSSVAVSEAKTAFLDIYNDLKGVLDSKEMGLEKRLYKYAVLWCAVKINDACKYEDEILYFPISYVAEKCRSLCAAYPDFGNAKVLLGLCYEPSSNSANEALAAFDSALNEMRSECFASAIYYRIGKRYEPYPDKREYVKKAYESAYQRKTKFRIIFKLAIGARDRGDIEGALEWFDEIRNKLKLKQKLHFLDPLELEYLFKAYVHKCYLYYKEDDVRAAIREGEEAIKIKNIVENEETNNSENHYFAKFYGADSDKYRKILAARFSINVINKMLAECYSKILDEERAQEYRNKVLEESSYKEIGDSWKIRVVN